MDQRVNETYAKASNATNKNALSDPYVKAVRWASDRIGKEGVIAYISNNSFLDTVSFDGMRKCLGRDFSRIYLIDLGGNVRRNPKISGTTHNVFGIQVGVCISLLVRRARNETDEAQLFYASMGEYWRKEEKYKTLDGWLSLPAVPWAIQKANSRPWNQIFSADDFDVLTPLAIIKRGASDPTEGVIFSVLSNGNDSGRDKWVYNFSRDSVAVNAKRFSEIYNSEVDRFARAGRPKDLDSFVISDETKIKWTRNAKRDLRRGKYAVFDPAKIRLALYHAFAKQFLYPGKIYNKEVAQFPRIFPTIDREIENVVICVPGAGNRKGFGVLATNLIPTLDVAFEKIQCFPFYTYDEDGSNRRENITDWALEEFRETYGDYKITKWDIFHYTYAVLHHPEYRTRYAANLKRELPRIPFAPAFPAFVKAGKRLAELHVDYEKQKEYPLERREKPGEKLNLRVEKMRLSKDKQTLIYNDFLTLTGIPKETYDYRLGNRSALEWVIDQYQVSTDKRSGITNDPNRDDDKEYILRLIGQVITVSLETVKIVNALPDLGLPKEKIAEVSDAIQ
jgi:predicted helicase